MALNAAPISGFKDLVYALMTTEDTSSVEPVYGTVASLGASAQFGFDPAFSQTTGYYDDAPLYVASSHGEMSFTASLDDVLPTGIAAVLGQTYSDGKLLDNVSDDPPYCAIGGIFTRADGTEERFWFPKVKFAKGSITVDTKGSSVSFQNVAMSGRVVALKYNGNFRVRTREGDTLTTPTWSAWFDAPVIA